MTHTITIKLNLKEKVQTLKSEKKQSDDSGQFYIELNRACAVRDIQELLTKQLEIALEDEKFGSATTRAELSAAIRGSSACYNINDFFALEEHLKNILNDRYQIDDVDIYLTIDLQTRKVQSIIRDNGIGFDMKESPWDELSPKSLVPYHFLMTQLFKMTGSTLSPNLADKKSLGGKRLAFRTLSEISQLTEGLFAVNNVNYINNDDILDKDLHAEIFKKGNKGAVMIFTSSLFEGKLKDNCAKIFESYGDGPLADKEGVRKGLLRYIKYLDTQKVLERRPQELSSSIEEEASKSSSFTETSTPSTSSSGRKKPTRISIREKDAGQPDNQAKAFVFPPKSNRKRPAPVSFIAKGEGRVRDDIEDVLSAMQEATAIASVGNDSFTSPPALSIIINSSPSSSNIDNSPSSPLVGSSPLAFLSPGNCITISPLSLDQRTHSKRFATRAHSFSGHSNLYTPSSRAISKSNTPKDNEEVAEQKRPPRSN